jgi:predicted CoA-binding protein
VGDRFRDPEVIERVLADSTTWAVVGLGDNPDRPAYGVAAFLQAHGKRVVPVHPHATRVLGEPVYRSLADVGFDIDVVDIFRRSDAAGAVVDEAVLVGATAVWLQIGVIDADAAERAAAAGLDVVMDTCPKVEWPRFGPKSGGPKSRPAARRPSA